MHGKRVNIVTKNLFARCKNAKDYAEIPQEELEGNNSFYRLFSNKAKNIRAMAAKLIAEHGSKVPRSLDALAALPGVGLKDGQRCFR